MKVRYRFIDSQVLDFFQLVEYIKPELLVFPLDMISIIHLFNNYRIWSYQYYAEKFKMTIGDVIINCQSNSGCTFYNREDNAHVIVFNKSLPQGRQQWTLAHELGHCFLNHFDKICDEQIAENNITSIFDSNLESEADYFASVALSPFPLFEQLKIKSPIDIQHMFGLSTEASLNRFKNYSNWKIRHYKTHFDNDLNRLFQPFLLKYKQ